MFQFPILLQENQNGAEHVVTPVRLIARYNGEDPMTDYDAMPHMPQREGSLVKSAQV
jgi:hypothetical protein